MYNTVSLSLRPPLSPFSPRLSVEPSVTSHNYHDTPPLLPSSVIRSQLRDKLWTGNWKLQSDLRSYAKMQRDFLPPDVPPRGESPGKRFSIGGLPWRTSVWPTLDKGNWTVETMELLKFKFSPFSSLFYFYFPGRNSSWEKFLSCREKEEDFSFFAHVNK